MLDLARLFAPVAAWWSARRAYSLSPEALREIEAAQSRRRQALADPDMSPIDKLIFWWGEEATPPAAEEALNALESCYAVRLPDDFRAYLKRMPLGNNWDDDGTS